MELVQIVGNTPTFSLTGVYKGVYAAGTDYAVGEVVSYNGGTYVMHTDAAAGTAPTDTTKWQAVNSPQAYVESLDQLSLVNATTDNTISIDQNGNVGTDVSTDGAIHIENTGNSGIGLGVYTNIGATADGPLVHFKSDNTAFDQDVLLLTNDGARSALEIDHNSDGASAIKIDATSAGTSLFYGLEISGTGGNYIGGILIHVSGATGEKGIGINLGNMEATDTIFKFPVDNTDPTGGGGAATGRIKIETQGTGGGVRYIPYYT